MAGESSIYLPFLAVEAVELMAVHSYEKIKTPAERDRLKEMPHRHGALHGLIGYESSRDSLNALFLLDFVLAACHAIVCSNS
jgi:hypothetical protein